MGLGGEVLVLDAKLHRLYSLGLGQNLELYFRECFSLNVFRPGTAKFPEVLSSFALEVSELVFSLSNKIFASFDDRAAAFSSED